MNYITRVILALTTFTLFGNLFFYRELTPLSTGLFFLGLSIFILFIAERRHRSMIVLVVMGVFSILVLWTRAAQVIQTQGVLMMATITATLWYLSLSASGSFASFTDTFLTPLFAGLTYIRRSWSLIIPKNISAWYQESIRLFADNKTHSRNISMLIGIAIAVPTTIILVAMFASADPIYFSYVKNVFSPEFLQELPWRLVLSVLLCIAAVPLVFPRQQRVFVSPGQVFGRFHMVHEFTIVMALVALVIASFIVVQWPYVFANVKAEIDLSRFGVATYAEYVTRGFVELLRVSAFIYGLLWLGLTALRQPTDRRSRVLLVLQWIVLGEFLLLVVSIARRVYLYQMYHGLTLIRVYGTFFLIWLGLVALTLAGRHLTGKIRFGLLEGAFTILLFVIMGLWNVEHHIATNHPPTVNKRIDYVYLSRMSADGVAGWVKAYDHAKEVIEKYSATSGEIDRNARREIAYAYYILREMTNRHYDHAFTYASVSEFQVYIRALVDFQTSRLEEERLGLVEYQTKYPKETWVKDRLTGITREQELMQTLVKKSLTDLNTLPKENESRESQEYASFSIEGWLPLPTFNSLDSPTLLSFYNTYIQTYWYGDTARSSGDNIDWYRKTTDLDRFYSRNMSELSAFHIMKRDIPLAELHALQVKYFDLYRRISRQSARDYEADISLESPLL